MRFGLLKGMITGLVVSASGWLAVSVILDAPAALEDPLARGTAEAPQSQQPIASSEPETQDPVMPQIDAPGAQIADEDTDPGEPDRVAPEDNAAPSPAPMLSQGSTASADIPVVEDVTPGISPPAVSENTIVSQDVSPILPSPQSMSPVMPEPENDLIISVQPSKPPTLSED